MENFWQGFEKQAGFIGRTLGKFKPFQNYKAMNESTGFIAKKYLGRALLGGTGVAYGLHKVTQPPQSEEQKYQEAQTAQG